MPWVVGICDMAWQQNVHELLQYNIAISMIKYFKAMITRLKKI